MITIRALLLSSVVLALVSCGAISETRDQKCSHPVNLPFVGCRCIPEGSPCPKSRAINERMTGVEKDIDAFHTDVLEEDATELLFVGIDEEGCVTENSWFETQRKVHAASVCAAYMDCPCFVEMGRKLSIISPLYLSPVCVTFRFV